MQEKITDESGNLKEQFLDRLDQLKKKQAANILQLEKLRVDVNIQRRNDEIERQNEDEINEQIYEMWRDFDLTQRIIGIVNYLKTSIDVRFQT